MLSQLTDVNSYNITVIYCYITVYNSYITVRPVYNQYITVMLVCNSYVIITVMLYTVYILCIIYVIYSILLYNSIYTVI